MIAEKRQLPKYIETMYGGDPWITSHTVENFGTGQLSDANSNNLGSILIYYPIGLCMLILCLIVIIIGIIYTCCRCAGQFSPYIYCCETLCQCCCRWILSILMFVLIILIMYCLIIIAYSTWAIVYYQQNNDSANTSGNITESQKKINDISKSDAKHRAKREDSVDTSETIKEVLKSVENGVKENFHTSCTGITNLLKIKKEFATIELEVDDLCYDILVWGDLVRLQYRNITSFVAQTDKGRKILRRLPFQLSDAGAIAMEAFFELYQAMALANQTMGLISTAHDHTNKLVETVNGNIHNVINPEAMQNSLDLRKEDDNPAVTTKNSRKAQSAKKRRGEKEVFYLEMKPLWVIIIEWICICLIILICITLLLALVFKCCAAPQATKHEISCQKCACCFFQIAVFMIFIHFLLVLVPFLWNFSKFVVVYNSKCELFKTNAIPTTTNITTSNETLQGTSETINGIEDLENITASIVTTTTAAPPDEDNNQKNESDVTTEPSPEKINELVELVDSMMPPQHSHDMKTIKKSAHRYKEEYMTMNIPNMIEIVQNYINETYLNHVFDELSTFAVNEMNDEPVVEFQELTLCNLHALKDNYIENYANGMVKDRVNQIVAHLKELKNIIRTDFDKILNECLDELDNIEKYYRDELNRRDIIERILRDLEPKNTIDNTTEAPIKKEVPEEEVTKKKKPKRKKPKKESNDSQKEGGKNLTSSECYDYAMLLAYIWTWLIPIFFLLLPLIPIAIYLSRIYICCVCVADRNCKVVKVKDKRGRVRHLILRIKFLFKPNPDLQECCEDNQ